MRQISAVVFAMMMNSENSHANETFPLDYFVAGDAKLVVIYQQGRFISVPVSRLLLTKQQPSKVHIDADLFKTMLRKKELRNRELRKKIK